MPSAETGTWDTLPPPWRSALTEAWASWCDGNLGIGAVLVDPETGDVVASGRNRVAEPAIEPGRLGGNFMAHAEMNALAALDSFKADGLHLYTTLEPCLMCAATTLFMHVDTVHFAASDEFFAGVDELWQHHPYSARWQPARVGPLGGRIGAFARVLPLVIMLSEQPHSRMAATAARTIPELMAVARELAADGTVERLAADRASAAEAFDRLSPRLPD